MLDEQGTSAGSAQFRAVVVFEVGMLLLDAIRRINVRNEPRIPCVLYSARPSSSKLAHGDPPGDPPLNAGKARLVLTTFVHGEDILQRVLCKLDGTAPEVIGLHLSSVLITCFPILMPVSTNLS